MPTSHVAKLLPRMMRELAVDPAVLGEAHPEVLLALQVGCDLCDEVHECRRSLKDGVARDGYEDFCLNAFLLKAVGAQPGRPARHRVRKAILGALPELRALAVSICASGDAADDLVQETLARAFASLDDLEHEADIAQALSSRLRELARCEQNHHRPTMRSCRKEDKPDTSEQDFAVAMAALRRVLPQLPSDEREALVLVVGQGRSPQDAASLLGASVNDVRRRTERGLSKLTGLLSPTAINAS